MYLYQELVQTFSFRKKNIFASFERVCLQTLACLALAKPMRSSREESQKYEEGVLGQAESSQTLSPPTALRGYFSDSMCICPSACPAGGKDAWKFRISVHDYKTSLKSFLVGAFRTQLNLNSIDLSSGPSSLCPILNGDFCNHLLGRERCSAVSDGGSSATRCAQNIFVSFQNIRIQSPNIWDTLCNPGLLRLCTWCTK